MPSPQRSDKPQINSEDHLQGLTEDPTRDPFTEPLRAVSITVCSAGRRAHFPEVSLPCLEALEASPTARAAEELFRAEGDAILPALRKLLAASEVAIHFKGFRNSVGVLDQVRRRDADEYDRKQAAHAVGHLLATESRIDVRALVCGALTSGSSRVKRILLDAMEQAEYLDVDLAQACIPLLRVPELRPQVLQIIRTGHPLAKPLAKVVVNRLGVLRGNNQEGGSVAFEEAAETVNQWCRANSNYGWIFKRLNAPDAPDRAAAINALGREGAPRRESLQIVLEALHDPERVVVAEVFGVLRSFGLEMRGYAQAIYDVSHEEDDFATLLGLDLLSAISPDDPRLFAEAQDHLQPYLLLDEEGELNDFESDEAWATRVALEPLARIAARALSQQGPAAQQCVSQLIHHRSAEARLIAVRALREAALFSEVEEFLSAAVKDSPAIASAAFNAATSFGVAALPWLGRIEARMIHFVTGTDGQSSEGEIFRAALECRRAIEGR